jgi:hypothetical protein
VEEKKKHNEFRILSPHDIASALDYLTNVVESLLFVVDEMDKKLSRFEKKQRKNQMTYCF